MLEKIVKCSKKFQDNRCLSRNKTNEQHQQQKLSKRSQSRGFFLMTYEGKLYSKKKGHE